MAGRLRQGHEKKLRERLLAHLWTRGPQPPEYLDLILCRDIYRCLPDELDRQPLDRILDHLACLELEAEVRTLRQQARRRPPTL